MSKGWLDSALSLLYPPRCLVCRLSGEQAYLCDRCNQAITPVPDPQCDRCGHPFGGGSGCYNCRVRQPAFVRGRALGGYDGVLRDAIHCFKYRDRPTLAEPLGIRLAAFARNEAHALHDLDFDAIIPVPMHPIRKRLRGYNQSERLAYVVGRELGLPVQTKALKRTRPTRPQVGLAGENRQSNLQDAFAVTPRDAVAQKTLLLLDDVTTTGSTLNFCAETLLVAGAKAVYALTLAAG